MASLTGMEGFLGVDKDGAPIMAPTLKPRRSGPKREALTAEEILDEAPILVAMVRPERAALTVHEILEAVTTEPPGPTVPVGKTEKHPELGVLMQKEFERGPVDVQRSVATFRLPNPGKVFRYTVLPLYLASFTHL